MHERLSLSHVLKMGLIVAVTIHAGAPVSGQPGTVQSGQKISDTEGDFDGPLDDGDWFGHAVADLGDLDGDGINDLAVGAPLDDDGGTNRGAVWILFLNADGTVRDEQKISDTEGGFMGVLDDDDHFGREVALIADINADGINDLAVGAPEDDDGGTDRGAIWLLRLTTAGTVISHQKIGSGVGGFGGALGNGDRFGDSIACIGDIDGDTVEDLAVGAYLDDDGGPNRGAIWILFMNANGTVGDEAKISATSGGFQGPLDDGDRFGFSVAALGDFNGDIIPDIAVGAQRDDDGGTDRGAVWILLLNPNGTVFDFEKIGSGVGGFGGVLDDEDYFGTSMVAVADMDGDAVHDLAVGANRDDDGGLDRGAVWILFMNADGTVKDEQKISDLAGGFEGDLDNDDRFGHAVAAPNLIIPLGPATVPISVGVFLDDDASAAGTTDRGAVWVLRVWTASTVLLCPDTATVLAGAEISGDSSDICDEDGSLWVIQSSTFAAVFSPAPIAVEVNGTVNPLGGTDLTLRLVGGPEFGSNTAFIQLRMWNYATDTYVGLPFINQPDSDDSLYEMTRPVDDFVGPDGEVRAEITCAKTATGPVRLRIDQLVWQVN